MDTCVVLIGSRKDQVRFVGAQQLSDLQTKAVYRMACGLRQSLSMPQKGKLPVCHNCCSSRALTFRIARL